MKSKKKTWTSSSTIANDWTLHQLAPYIGRMKPAMASALVKKWTKKGDVIADPFCGSGVVPLETIGHNRNVVAGDWNPYAVLLTKAKLFPPKSEDAALRRLNKIWKISRDPTYKQDLRTVPQWVRRFFHPNTLRNALAFRDACIHKNDHFLLACLLGILHHQRPGFLSFPSSHLVPYLRNKKYPQNLFPEMYTERDVYSRIKAKIKRLYRRPFATTSNTRRVFQSDARNFPKIRGINAVITSPPYMNELDYVRDNRLRLWFIHRDLPLDLELVGSNREFEFMELMRSVCCRLAPQIVPGGIFALVVGDASRGGGAIGKTAAITRKLFATEKRLSCFRLKWLCRDAIPDVRRSRHECKGTKTETILVFQKMAKVGPK